MHSLTAFLAFFAVFINDASNQVTNTEYRLNYHVQPEQGWANDPNGPIHWNNQYHLFYQHYPNSSSPDWSDMHWGHVVSPDLVHWKYLPIALTPDQHYDKNGCWSGSAVDDNGTLTLIYTGYVQLNSSTSWQNQNIATSKDGVTFTKYEKNPVIKTWPIDGSDNFRDPNVWKHKEIWYMVVGNQNVNNRGRVVLYKSKDLRNWGYVGVLASSETLGTMWEMPDFFELDGKFVLIVNPQNLPRDDYNYVSLQSAGYFVGDYDYETNIFKHGPYHEVDLGHDFVETRTFFDQSTNRRMIFGWMGMWDAYFPEKNDGWAGAHTIPRELHLNENGKLTMTPVAELKLLRENQIYNSRILVSEQFDTGIPLNSTELFINIPIDKLKADKAGFTFTCMQNVAAGWGQFRVYYDKKREKIVSTRIKDQREADWKDAYEISLHIYVDRSSIEIFVNGGITFTSRFYVPWLPTLTLFTENGQAEVDVQAYSLKNIWKN